MAVPSSIRELAGQTVVVAEGRVFQASSRADGILCTSWANLSFAEVGPAQILLDLGADIAADVAKENLKLKLRRDAQREEATAYFLFELVPKVDRSANVTRLGADEEWSAEEVTTRVANPLSLFAEGDWFFIYGRLWQLERGPERPGPLEFRTNAKTFSLTGQFRTLGEIWSEWERRVDVVLGEFVQSLAARARRDVRGVLEAARDELTSAGYLQRGPLVLLQDGMTVLHIVPPHPNRTLGAIADNELGIGCQLSLPPRVPPAGLAVYRRTDRSWRQVSFAHGICLGEIVCDETESPLVSWLSRAAVRIASAGRFHERE